MKFFIIFFLVLTNSSYATESDKVEKLEKMVTLLQSQINVLRKNEGVSKIGEIRYSILPEEAFQELYGKGWVLMNGSCIAKKCDSNHKDSKLFEFIIKDNKYYDKFNDTIRRGMLPDLRGRFLRMLNNGATGDGHDPDTGRQIGSYQKDEFTKHFHDISASSGVYSGDGKDRRNYQGYMTRHVGPEPTNDAGNSPETRPKNIAVNAYIKIN